MASKQKRQPPKTQAVGTPLRRETDRLIEKGRYKDAVKEAKLCFRADPTPEHHHLLETAYFLRAKQMAQAGMLESAREVAGHLLDFGITDPKLAEPGASLLVALGMSGQALHLREGIEDPAARERVFLQAADQAVLHPERKSLSTELNEGGQLIRSALEALAKGNADAALGGLREVARNSPFADWKLFARGLAAYNEGNNAEAAANWDRLDSARTAFKISRALSSLNQPETHGGKLPKLDALEKACFGEPILGPLCTIKDLIAEDRLVEALRVVGPLRFALRRTDPALAERLTRVLYPIVFRAATETDSRQGRSLLDHFIRVAEPLSIDPRWNRTRGLWCDEVGEDLDKSEGYWRQYLKDIESDPALFGVNSDRAQALVWLHLGRQFVELLDGEVPFQNDGESRQDVRRVALDCFEASLKLLPTRIETYKELRETLDKWDEPLKAAKAARRLLEVFPDDFETLSYLADHHKKREEPDESLPYVQRMRALKPLDQATLATEISGRLALARAHSLSGKWSDGRAEYEAIERLVPASARSIMMLTRKAVFELKAEEPDRAQEYINEGVELSQDRASFWLAIAIEARRIALPKAEQDRFDQRWGAESSKKPTSKTAGAISQILDDFLIQKISYPGMEGHLREVLAYLSHTKRLKYSREDLAKVCGFLRSVPKGAGLALGETFAKRGIKLFPKAAEFPFMMGTHIMLSTKPTYSNVAAAKKNFEKARVLAETEVAENPDGPLLLPKIQEMLTRVSHVQPMSPFGFPFSPFSRKKSTNPIQEMQEILEGIAERMGVSPEELTERLRSELPFDALDDLDGDFDDDFDDEDPEEPPRARPKQKAKPKKKKK
jgi:tetratricopeptide (TPR) repeat protein